MIPGAILDRVSVSGLIAIGNKEIDIIKNIKGLRKLEGFLTAIFRSLEIDEMKMFKVKSPLNF